MREILIIFAFRALPFAAFGLCTKTLGWRVRLFSSATFVAVVLLSHPARRHWLLIALVLGALVYFAAASTVVYFLATRLQQRPRWCAFATSAFAYVLLPALVVESGAVLLVVLMGWSYMLASYSYYVDVASDEGRTDLGECLFFILVNPTIVFRERGIRVSRPRIGGVALARVSVGLGLWILQDAWNQHVVGLWAPVFPATPLGAAGVGDYANRLAYFWCAAIALYFAHSGLANIQIGLVRMFGWKVPECYRYPFLSTSPLDFWRRWNIWVLTWVKRYVFFPLARVLLRARNPVRRHASRALLVLLTFGAVGLLHDYGLWAMGALSQSVNPLSATIMFLIFGLIVVGWRVAEAGLQPVRTVVERLPGATFASRAISWLCFVQVACAMQWLAMSVLAGDGLPSP